MLQLFRTRYIRGAAHREIELLATRDPPTAFRIPCLIGHDWPVLDVQRVTRRDIPAITACIAATHGRVYIDMSEDLSGVEFVRVYDCVRRATTLHSIYSNHPGVLIAALSRPTLTCLKFTTNLQEYIPIESLPSHTNLTALFVPFNPNLETISFISHLVKISPNIKVFGNYVGVLSTHILQACTTFQTQRLPSELPPSATTLVIPQGQIVDFGVALDLLALHSQLTRLIVYGRSAVPEGPNMQWLQSVVVPFPGICYSLRTLVVYNSMLRNFRDAPMRCPNLEVFCVTSGESQFRGDNIIKGVIDGDFPNLVNLSMSRATVSASTLELLATLLVRRPSLEALRVGSSPSAVFGKRRIQPLATAIAAHPSLKTFGFDFRVCPEVLLTVLMPAFSAAPSLVCVESAVYVNTFFRAPYTGLLYACHDHTDITCKPNVGLCILPTHMAPTLHWHTAGNIFASQTCITTLAMFCLVSLRIAPTISPHLIRDVLQHVTTAYVRPTDILPPHCWSYNPDTLASSHLAALA